jgi:LysM repeat protein
MGDIHYEVASGIIRAELAKLILLMISFTLLFLLWGCSVPTEISSMESTATFMPFSSSSSTPTNTHTFPTVSPQPTMGPTPTPFSHVVQKDDTLLGIAIRYGISLEELLTANPGINPTILSIGQRIIIPGPEGDSASNFLPAATPIPLPLSEAQCFPTATNHLWCVASLKNSMGYPLEGVSVIISLLNEAGEVIESHSAFSPINMIPVGVVIPFSSLFALPSDGYSHAVVYPVTSYRAENIEDRYLPLEWVLNTDEPGKDQKTWKVAGQLFSREDDEKIAPGVSILMVGLDENGGIVGFRQLELDQELGSGTELNFELEVFSLGPPIDHIQVFAEAWISTSEE